MLGQPEGEVLSSRAQLRIRGDELPFDEIGSTLGLVPSTTYRKGLIHFEIGTPASYDSWIYWKDGKTLDDCLTSLWEELRTHADYLRQLQRRYSVVVSCSCMIRKIHQTKAMGGVTIGHRSLSLFTELEIPLRVGITQFE